MADAQTAYELRLLFKYRGCPVCALAQRTATRYVDTLFYESVLDPGRRERIRASLGLCYEHAWLTIESKLSDALGLAIVYHDLAATLLARLPEKPDSGGRERKALVEALSETRLCPACETRRTVEERSIKVLGEALQKDDYLDDYRKSDGLCLPHLRLMIEETGNQKVLAAVINHQRQRLEGLKEELSEFIRKNDYRFQDEGMGAERDSYQRAAEQVTGKRRPASKADLFPEKGKRPGQE
ncbi:MAG: hypothetical protein JXB85_12170 [Anaerolineales bacterium]|nr:hypothetical protein [Anaerolineales bacterium]